MTIKSNEMEASFRLLRPNVPAECCKISGIGSAALTGHVALTGGAESVAH
jgi:hypothetical protein